MNDKIKHIIAGLLIAGFIGIPACIDSGNLFAGLWPALTGGCIAAGIKEWCDMHVEGNKFDWADFAFTAIGVCIAMGLIVALHFAKG